MKDFAGHVPLIKRYGAFFSVGGRASEKENNPFYLKSTPLCISTITRPNSHMELTAWFLGTFYESITPLPPPDPSLRMCEAR